MQSRTPYSELPERSFWKTGVAQRHPIDIDELWQPKWPLDREMVIATAGSCFAQHVGRALRDSGANWLDSEPAPPAMSDVEQRHFNYGLFSFRTGNIYTPRQLRQWLEWAAGNPCPDLFWMDGERHFDPFRPAIEPDGFSSREEAQQARASTLACIASGLRRTDLFVFTLGLTECWRDAVLSCEYPACPGTVAGQFDASRHLFHSSTFEEIVRDLTESWGLLRGFNPSMRILLTVSPVPLTATATGHHVLVATMASKAILRAAADQFVAGQQDADYFPSFEMITAPPYRSMFFDPNMRTINPLGVNTVLSTFLSGFDSDMISGSTKTMPETAEVVCEDAILEFYAKR